jgi:hypothetical protein
MRAGPHHRRLQGIKEFSSVSDIDYVDLSISTMSRRCEDIINWEELVTGSLWKTRRPRVRYPARW